MVKSFEKEIKRLKMAIDCFESTTTRRIEKLVDSVDNDPIKRKPIIRTILSSIAHMYGALYKDKIIFSVSLLIPEKEQILKTSLTECNGNLEHLWTNTPLAIERKEIFGIVGGTSVAAKAWRHCRPLSSNDRISYCYKNQEASLKSVISLPIVCSESLHLKLNEHQYIVDRVMAVLCIASSNEKVFDEESCPIHTTMLTPFASMINVQISLRAIEKLKQKVKSDEKL